MYDNHIHITISCQIALKEVMVMKEERDALSLEVLRLREVENILAQLR